MIPTKRKLELKSVCYESNRKMILENINFIFSEGNLYGIYGPNGSGKTSLLKIINGLLTKTCGSILWEENELNYQNRETISRLISYVPQSPHFAFDFTVLEMVIMGTYAQKYSKKRELEASEQALQEVQAWHLKNRKMSELSGGEKQRILIARALAAETSIILLDEPAAHLDLKFQFEIWNLTKALSRLNKIVIMSSHDISEAKNYCDVVLLLKNGKKILEGPPGKILTKESIETTFEISNLTS